LASPPYFVGSVSGPRILWNSKIEPGQPCVTTSGNASACGDRTWRKWMRWSSIVVVNCGNELSSASCLRQSNFSRQYATRSTRYERSVP